MELSSEVWHAQIIEKSLFSSGYLRFFKRPNTVEVSAVELFLSEICNGLRSLVCGFILTMLPCSYYMNQGGETSFIVCRILIKFHYTRGFCNLGASPAFRVKKRRLTVEAIHLDPFWSQTRYERRTCVFSKVLPQTIIEQSLHPQP